MAKAPSAITSRMVSVGIAGNKMGGKGSPAGGRAPASITGKLTKKQVAGTGKPKSV